VDDDDEGRRGGDGGRPLRHDDQDGGRGTDPGRWTAASGRGYDSSGGGTSPGAQAPGVNYGVAMPRYSTSRFRHQPVPSASWPYSGRQVPPPSLPSPQFDAKLEHTYHAYYILESHARILTYEASDLKNMTFYVLIEMTYQKVLKSHQQKFSPQYVTKE